MTIFSKDKGNGTSHGESDQAAPDGLCLISRKIILEGTLRGTEDVVVEGTIKGAIALESNLRISASARVEATVHARNVVVEGTLVGDVSADQRIELLASAAVDGNIKAPKVVVAEGARFRGAVDMGTKKP